MGPPGRGDRITRAFFNDLGAQRSAELEVVSADAAPWISRVVDKRAPQALRTLDPFHVVALASDALDDVRKQISADARRRGDHALAKALYRSRVALWRKPEGLSTLQREKLADIAQHNKPLYRGYLLREQLRMVFQQDTPEDGIALLDHWLAWASRSRLTPFVKLARRIRRHRNAIHATLHTGVTNARTESLNTRLRLIMRRAFGFHSPEALIAIAMLAHGGLRVPGSGVAPG